MTEKLFNFFDFTTRHEGFIDKPYIDPLVAKTINENEKKIALKNYPKNDDKYFFTIGYGQLCRYVDFPYTCTKEQAVLWLKNKLSDLILEVNNQIMIKYGIDERFEMILCALAYQIGVRGLSNFKMALSALSANNLIEARHQFLDSDWSKQTPRRANELISYLA